MPYRDSKLTRILQPSLGGNARTAVICNVTPAACHLDETHSTLRFACRAKKVANRVERNEVLSDAALVARQQKEIERLRARLQASQKRSSSGSHDSGKEMDGGVSHARPGHHGSSVIALHGPHSPLYSSPSSSVLLRPLPTRHCQFAETEEIAALRARIAEYEDELRRRDAQARHRDSPLRGRAPDRRATMCPSALGALLREGETGTAKRPLSLAGPETLTPGSGPKVKRSRADSTHDAEGGPDHASDLEAQLKEALVRARGAAAKH